jgi:hypothetical protein
MTGAGHTPPSPVPKPFYAAERPLARGYAEQTAFKILEHLGLPATGPPKAPARGAAQLELDGRPVDELRDELPNHDSSARKMRRAQTRPARERIDRQSLFEVRFHGLKDAPQPRRRQRNGCPNRRRRTNAERLHDLVWVCPGLVDTDRKADTVSTSSAQRSAWARPDRLRGSCCSGCCGARQLGARNASQNHTMRN